jgi:hypothetical protein
MVSRKELVIKHPFANDTELVVVAPPMVLYTPEEAYTIARCVCRNGSH